MRRTIGMLAVALVATSSVALAAAKPSTGVAARPEQLKYPELVFDVPEAAKYRHELAGGVVAYVVEEHALPLVKIQAAFRTGAFREPDGKSGLAALTATMLRKGARPPSPRKRSTRRRTSWRRGSPRRPATSRRSPRST